MISGFAMSLLSCCIFLLSDSFIMVITARLLAGMTAAMWVMATVYTRSIYKDQSSKRWASCSFNGPSPIHQHGSQRLPRPFVRLDVSVWIGVAVSCIGLILSFTLKITGPAIRPRGWLCQTMLNRRCVFLI
ncbi:hypothetical protein PO124_15315 [Bacillus licheniformis]|nr:hypothetical protein [Bacillus licheniformis]